jgi:hypothetical protein
VLRFVSDFWRSACRPPVVQRCGTIAFAVGTLLSLVNQGDRIVAGRFDWVLVFRIIGNYLIPFVVSNLGAMTSLQQRKDQGQQSRDDE